VLARDLLHDLATLPAPFGSREHGRPSRLLVASDSPFGRSRVVPLTDALVHALQAHRHLRGELVLFGNDGRPATSFFLRNLLEATQKRAGLRSTGGLHILRHTFCSHMAMRGAPAKAIQELAGHAELTTTMRYMHLSPGARQDAINLLNVREPGRVFGDMAEPRIGGSVTKRDPS
jgi:integrase